MTFVAGAPAEALPVATGSFDMIVSNFAIEYSLDREAALAELARVLRPGGCAALVLHGADSTVTASSRVAIETYEAIAAAGIPDLVRRAAALRPDHLSRRKWLKDVLRRREDFPRPMLSYSGVEYFDIAERLLKGDPAARQDLAAIDGGVAMRLDLSREQARVALDEAAVAALHGRLTAIGFAVQLTELTCTYASALTEKVGWIALLTKRGS